MDVKLTKEDLISMVEGTVPYYHLFDNDLIKSLGYYTGGFEDKWTWRHEVLERLSEESLYLVYNMCKDSWKH